jgi:hypothetical protein
MNVQSSTGFTKADLLDKLGPSPTVGRVALFLNESATTTWRRLNNGQLRAIPGPGNTRVTLESLLNYLNGTEEYQRTYKRGNKPGEKKTKAKEEKKGAAQ